MSPATWIIVGATRGIGLEIVRQLLHRGERVIATVRNTSKASQLWTLSAGAAAPRLGSWCRLLECDVTVDESINVCFFPFSLFLGPHSSLSVSPSSEGGRDDFLPILLHFSNASCPVFIIASKRYFVFLFICYRAEWLDVSLLEICGRCGCNEGRAKGRLRCLECRDSQVSQCK